MTSPSINSKSVRSQIKAFDNSRFSEAIVNQPGSLWLQVLLHFSSFEISLARWQFPLVFCLQTCTEIKAQFAKNSKRFQGSLWQ